MAESVKAGRHGSQVQRSRSPPPPFCFCLFDPPVETEGIKLWKTKRKLIKNFVESPPSMRNSVIKDNTFMAKSSHTSPKLCLFTLCSDANTCMEKLFNCHVVRTK